METNSDNFDVCPACKNNIPKDATACTHCGAHMVIQYNTLGKILFKIRRIYTLSIICFVLGIIVFIANMQGNHMYSYTKLFMWGIIFLIPQLLLLFLPKDKITEKIWTN